MKRTPPVTATSAPNAVEAHADDGADVDQALGGARHLARAPWPPGDEKPDAGQGLAGGEAMTRKLSRRPDAAPGPAAAGSRPRKGPIKESVTPAITAW